MIGAMPSQNADSRVLRSRQNLGNSSSPVDSSLMKQGWGGGHIVRNRSLNSQQFERVTRLRKRVSRDEGNVENDGDLKEVSPQPDGTGNRRTRFKRSGSSTESTDDQKRKEIELTSRRLTRGMDGGRSSILTKLTNERAKGIDNGTQRKSHDIDQSLMGQRRNLIRNEAGTQIDGSSTVSTGLRKGPANVRVTRLKMAKWTLGTEVSFDNLRDAVDRNAENIVVCTREIAVKKLKAGQVRMASFKPSSSSSGSFINDKQKDMLGGGEYVGSFRDPFESAKDSYKEETLLELNGSNKKREGSDRRGFIPTVTGDGHPETWRNEFEDKVPNEKAQVKSEMGSERDSRIHECEAATPASMSKKVAVNAPTEPSNHTGSKVMKRKRVVELSPADIIQVEVGGPVTRGKLSRGSSSFAADGQAKVKESAAKAVAAQLATADFRDSTVSSLNGPTSVDLIQFVAYCDNVPCTVVNDIGYNIEKKQENLEQAAMMRRSNIRKSIATPVDAESEFSQESLHHERKGLNGLGKGRLKASVLSKEKSTPGRSEDKRASSLDKGEEALQGRVQIREPLHEQNSDVCESKGAKLGSEHLLNLTEKGAKANDIGSAPELDQGGMGPNDVACKIDTRGNRFLVATKPTETGGRQMRPRPLDLEQPLLVLIEGRDQDYYDLDGGSFNRMLQQQLEIKKPSCEQMSKGTLLALEKQDGKKKSIVIPSFRCLREYEEEQQRFRTMYDIPESYIRAFSGTANEYNNQAEYDMDEEDEGWLHNFNQTMCSLGTSPVISEDQFENLIDVLENKAADLENLKSFPVALDQDHFRHGTILQTSEECCICNGGENSANNLVFKCVDCGILVHQSCYGVRGSEIHARDKKWYCRKCESVAAGRAVFDVRCALCCKQGGALKPATEPFKWVHVVCALYTNETFFVNADAMEPIDGLVAADARARKQRRRCWLCGFKEGSVERCSVRMCEAVFHVSCGVTRGASFELQHSNQQVVRVRSFCSKHANVAPVARNLKQKGFDNTKEDKKLSRSGGFEERLVTTAEEIKRRDPLSKQIRQGKSVRGARTPRKDCSVQETINSTHSKSVSIGDDRKCISLRHRMVAPDCAKQRYFDGKAKEPNIVSEACIDIDGLEKGNSREKLIGKPSKDQDSILSLKDALELDVAAPEFVEGVYWYWAWKRAKCEGALLHRIQQEQAAKNFGIFNPNATYDKISPFLFQGNALKHSGMNFETRQKMVAARQQLQKLRELTNLIVRRERIKLDIYSIDLDITQLILEELGASVTGDNCLLCKKKGSALQCTVCNKEFCVQCFKSKNEDGSRGWLSALKLLKSLCFGCQKEKYQEDDVLVSRISYLVEENGTNCQPCQDIQHHSGRDLPSLVNTTFEQEQQTLLRECHDSEGCLEMKDDLFHGDHEEDIPVSVECTKCAPKKPYILFPPSNLNDLENSASEVFWESVERQSHCKKTVLVSELLKTTLNKSHEDVADPAKRYSKSPCRRKR